MHREPLLAWVVGERPPDGVRHREGPGAAGTKDAGDLRVDPSRVGDERYGPVCGEDRVERGRGEREGSGVGLDERDGSSAVRDRPATRASRPGAGSALDSGGSGGVAGEEHPDRHVGGHDTGPLGGEPTGALRGARADLEDVEPRDGPEQSRVRLAEPFRAPHQLVLEEPVVLPLVLGCVLVPPAAGRGATDVVRHGRIPCGPERRRHVSILAPRSARSVDLRRSARPAR
ncbi:hypothetical protein GCM10025865_28460 [Paraoerskovia sediminicola]|uniref:Uncharacterized protein n=1 Tax=Paraoerskovia sediminicola TaxID=1138587 RepID=A0ABN6XIL9_9CELL|nr:hypothetical protein GCM10025865_28460 [Paraoerskovia sediminicola]